MKNVLYYAFAYLVIVFTLCFTLWAIQSIRPQKQVQSVPSKQDGRVVLHKLPNGTPCAVLISEQGNNAITCGWGYKEK